MSRFRLAALVGVPVAAILIASLGPSAGASVSTVSGNAYGACIALGGSCTATPASGTLLAPTPTVTLPATGGGPINATAVPINLPGILTVGVLNVSTVGALGETGFAQSTSELAGVTVGGLPPLIPPALSIDAVRADCRSDSFGSSGRTSLVGINLPGIPSNPLPNTPVTVPGLLSVVLNEQTVTNTPASANPVTNGSTSIDVNALHVQLLPSILGAAVLDVVIGHVHCDAVGPNVLLPTTTSSSTTSTSTTAPSTTTTSTTMPGTTTTSTTMPGTTTTSTTLRTTTTTSTTVIGATTTTSTTVAAPGTTVTTAAPATTTTSTTVAVTVPPSGTTLPVATTTTTRPPTVAPPLARTGSNLMPMVGMALLAIALGTLVRRSADSLAPVPVTLVDATPPPPPEFRPAGDRPSAIRRRSRRNPLDPATSDALSAFESDPDEPDGSG